MGRIAIITDDPGWHGARLRESFSARGFSGEYVSLTDCRISTHHSRLSVNVPGFEEKLPDGVFVRGVPGGSLDEVVFYLDVLHGLNALGVAVYNDGRAIERSVDKAMTSFLLHTANIPTPPTWVVRDRGEALSICKREMAHGHQIVSKPLFGSQGIGLEKIATVEELPKLMDTNGIYYLQRYVGSKTRSSSDWRVFVIAGKAVAAMRRVGNSWLNNVAQGARCEPADADENMIHLAETAIEILQMNYGGVDIIRDQQGRYNVIEVNSVPAWKGLQSVCDENISDLLANDFLKRCHPPAEKESAAASF